MTLFKGHTCPVTNCPHNRGVRGLSCGFASDTVLICLHPRYKVRWYELAGLDLADIIYGGLDEPAPAPEPVAEAERGRVEVGV